MTRKEQESDTPRRFGRRTFLRGARDVALAVLAAELSASREQEYEPIPNLTAKADFGVTTEAEKRWYKIIQPFDPQKKRLLTDIPREYTLSHWDIVREGISAYGSLLLNNPRNIRDPWDWQMYKAAQDVMKDYPVRTLLTGIEYKFAKHGKDMVSYSQQYLKELGYWYPNNYIVPIQDHVGIRFNDDGSFIKYDQYGNPGVGFYTDMSKITRDVYKYARNLPFLNMSFQPDETDAYAAFQHEDEEGNLITLDPPDFLIYGAYTADRTYRALEQIAELEKAFSGLLFVALGNNFDNIEEQKWDLRKQGKLLRTMFCGEVQPKRVKYQVGRHKEGTYTLTPIKGTYGADIWWYVNNIVGEGSSTATALTSTTANLLSYHGVPSRDIPEVILDSAIMTEDAYGRTLPMIHEIGQMKKLVSSFAL